MLPLLIMNPTTDGEFVSQAAAVLIEGEGPELLEERLRLQYPRAVVRPSVVSNVRLDIWYVYRDGHWVRS